MRIRSFAKINLGLEIVRRRSDGYHDIRTLFQSVDFFDTLEFVNRNDGEISLRGTDSSVLWDEENLIYQAASLLKKRAGQGLGVDIFVEKNIPAGKGLGGGSSNAAMTLYALNELWGLALQKETLMRLGRTLGADVPYFLMGGLCLGTGRGDDLKPLADLDPMPCLLVLPGQFLSTASVYNRVPVPLTSKDKGSKIMQFLKRRDFRPLQNDLEEIVFRIQPQIKALKSVIQNLRPELSLISGSGSAVFGLFKEKETPSALLDKPVEGGAALLVETLSRERYWSGIRAGV
jgi:4-diphosphocytidyl-2-C-methyl-D-erythritol kinase